METIEYQKSKIENLRPWVEAETGMDFSGNRVTRLHDAVKRVLSREQPPTDLDQLMTLSRERGPFLERLSAELTVGESFFFRNEHHFRALRDNVLPEILHDNSNRREVRIWSAGCAGGEEPYSLAILLDQILNVPTDLQSQIANHESQTPWRVSILGTDLNYEFLERAREASYRPWSFRHTNIHEDRTYFSGGKDCFQLATKIRNTVRFAYLNLVKDVYPSPLTGTLGLDLILFRNVAIYLNSEVTRKIIERFYQALRPGGWLLLGETEVGLAPTDRFETRRFEQATFHHKPSGAEMPAERAPIRMPVLADFAVDVSEQTKASAGPTRQMPMVQPAPELPDWVPLPKQTSRSYAPESTVQQTDRLLREQKFNEAERTIERIADRELRAHSRFQLAQALLARAEIDRARQMLDRCLADEPLMVEAQLLHASFAEEAGDLEQAERAYRRALYVDRNCPMAHFHLALVQQQKGDAAGAQRSVRTTLKLAEHRDPHEPVEYGEGVCYGRLKEMAQMILEF